VEVLKEYRSILYGHTVRVYTDHKNLTHSNTQTVSQRIMRWRLVIEEFGIELIYIKGEHNVAADALSRLPRSDAGEVQSAGEVRSAGEVSVGRRTDEIMEVNLKSCFNLTKACMRPMLKARAGSIINMSSVVGVKGNAGQANYAASKAGILGFTKSVAFMA